MLKRTLLAQRRQVSGAMTRSYSASINRCGRALMHRPASFGASECGNQMTSPALCCAQRQASFRALIRTYGAPLAIYYLLFNECFVVLITYLLHTEAIGVGDIVSLLEYLGLEQYVDVRGFTESSRTVLGFEVSGRLLMNFGIATAFMSLWTPLQLPFCIATLPTIMRWCGRGRTVPSAAAAATG